MRGSELRGWLRVDPEGVGTEDKLEGLGGARRGLRAFAARQGLAPQRRREERSSPETFPTRSATFTQRASLRRSISIRGSNERSW